MSEIHGRITYSAEDIARIKAASFHDHVEATPKLKIEHSERVEYGKDMLSGKNTDGDTIRLEVNTNINAACFLNHYGDRSDTIWKDDIDLWIALLTRAREIMQKGGV